MTYCCADLEKLTHHGEAGLGLLRVTNKRGTRFILEYRKDWRMPVSAGSIQLRFCPFCGSELTGPSLMAADENSN